MTADKRDSVDPAKRRQAPGWRGAAPVPEHGTTARYQRPHKCRCEACREASRDYIRAYRQRTGNRYQRARDRAQRKAGGLYAAEHPAEWRALLDRELERIDTEEQSS